MIINIYWTFELLYYTFKYQCNFVRDKKCFLCSKLKFTSTWEGRKVSDNFFKYLSIVFVKVASLSFHTDWWSYYDVKSKNLGFKTKIVGGKDWVKRDALDWIRSPKISLHILLVFLLGDFMRDGVWGGFIHGVFA